MSKGVVSMSTTGLDVFDRAVQRANEWLVDLASDLGKDGDRPYAYRVLRSYLHVVRDRVTPEQAVDFASQLPLLLRGVFYDGWHPAKTPETYRDAATFVGRLVETAQLAGPTEASMTAETTTRMLRRRMSAGQVDELLDALPEAIRRVLQPQPPPAKAAATVGTGLAAETVPVKELPPELRSRVMAATGNAEIRVIERRGRAGNEAEEPGYEVYALAGDRFVHMVLRRRPDGSVEETTETMLPEHIRGVDIEAQHAALRDQAGRLIPVPANVAVAVGSLLASQRVSTHVLV
jgi:uncharacterized protein (DUF2267 family)